jgi:hypothetical protein
MGEAKRKRAAFLLRHPICCFCGGSELATTIDHVPGRVCFPGRAYPETFEFPACDKCQTASRLDELAFGFFARMLDRNPDNYDDSGTDKLITGLANNLRDILPNPYLNARQVRSGLKNLGLIKPSSISTSEIPMVEIPLQAHTHIIRYARKIAIALYYREQKRIADASYRVWVHWEQSTVPTSHDIHRKFAEMTPEIVHGTRSNLNFGDRFRYRCNKADEPDIMATMAGFGQGITIFTIITDRKNSDAIDNAIEWIDVCEALTAPCRDD